MAKAAKPADETIADAAPSGYFVDRVVICDAYREPDQHYKLLAGGKSKLAAGRRPSMRYLASAKASKGGIAGVVGKEARLLEDQLASEEELNEVVNQLREEIRDWREAAYPEVAGVTRRLLEWWFERDEERQSEYERLFFCQREAIETVIYLFEVRKQYQMPETGDLLRYALKLATGTGKTLVMALLIVWSTLHKHRVAGSSLSSNFLVLVPNLTVRDRVSGTDPLTKEPVGSGLNPDSEENLFDEFEMVPPEFAELFQPRVIVKNWQSIPLDVKRDDWISDEAVGGGRFIPASVLAAMKRRKRADPRAAVRRLLGGWSDLVIINDEAHHVYGEKKVKKGEDPQHIKWSKIIALIKQAASVPLIVDLTATPWYGSGAPPDKEGRLFEWLVSDFSVYDAFESGLVKVVRLPETTEKEHRYLDLWDQVKGATTEEEYISACKGAIASLYSSWKKDFDAWSQLSMDDLPDPSPVMLVVADTATRAQWLFDHLRTDYEYFRNPGDDDPAKWLTIQVNTAVFDAEKGKEAILREMVNTVGKRDKAGQHVRCIVSVNMLSEGWDVKGVTHILGLRAFGSPLLTEQIIGRGLRRTDYTALNTPIEERLKERPDEETVDVLGIPFVGFPVEKRKRPKIRGWTGSSTPIAPLEKKARFACELPNIRSWGVGISKPLSEVVDVGSLPKIIVDPKETPPEVSLKPVVGGASEELMTLEEFRREYPLGYTKMLLAKDLHSAVSAEEDGVVTGPTFEEVLQLVTAYVDGKVEAKGDSLRQDVGIYFWRKQALNVLHTAVQDAPFDTETIPIPGDPPALRTRDVPEFKWAGIAAEGKKAHWSKVPCHTQLEGDFAAFLDGAKDVVKYVKNERLGFSITYYENFRPRQYFPDFAVLLGDDTWWLVETKGEIRTNTMLKREAANLWCDRVTRSGRFGRWRHLFVQQRKFERALRDSVHTFEGLLKYLGVGEPQPQLTLVAIDDARVEKEQFETLLPVYSLEAAAGHFGEGKAVELEGWVEVEGAGRLTNEMFVAKAVGRSMEPQIKDGDYLIFRTDPSGTRQNKIVLAQGPIQDPEFGGPFTVKKYYSEKIVDDGGSWRHSKVLLLPLNKDFDPIEVPPAAEGSDPEVKIVAEYIGTLEGA